MAYKLDRADYLSESGARLLGNAIAAYWQAKGRKVDVRIEKGSFMTDKDRAAFWCIRSDLVRGLPTGADNAKSWYGGRPLPSRAPAQPGAHDD